MTKVIFIGQDGSRHEVDATSGQTLMQEAIDNEVPGILADCGGSCACATCHCYIDEAWIDKVGAPNVHEEGLLDFATAPRKPTSRLSCQVVLTDEMDGLIVEIAENA
jgi:ferredoxin, 2Fe-2S